MINKNQIKILFRKTISYLVPKSKNLFVFIPSHNPKVFSGNIKALIRYIEKNNIDINYRLLAYRPQLQKEAKEFNAKMIQSSIKGLWYTLRANHIVLDATTPDLKGNFSFIQLWHGTGFKNIGLLNELLSPKACENIKKQYLNCSMVISSAEIDVEKQNTSFDTDTTLITGLPRNDVFFNENRKDAIREKHDLSNFDYIYSYIPTFRDFNTIQAFSDEFWEQLNTVLIEKNALFLVKKHPWEKLLKIPTNYSNIKDVTDSFSDVQELLVVTDLLISDYSSILTDFSITKRPIIVYSYDFDIYIKTCRSIYYDLEETLPKPFIKTEQELLQKIKDDAWQQNKTYIESYEKFSKTFNFYYDGESSKRVINEMLKLVKN